VALTSGTRLGPYEILAPLGQGGMGVVYRARDTRLNREVAIKTLPEAFAADPDRLARFEREAQLLASLNHPNIAAIHGLEEAGGTTALVLELIEGETLADRLHRGAIPVEDALKLALQIAEALEAAHEKGVMHRDLKPANIMIQGARRGTTPASTADARLPATGGKVKVLDFGLAKALAGDTSSATVDQLSHSPTLSLAATGQGVILGTAAYMSPEQASGAPADRRADIWSFGVVLFEMLTGRRMFTGKTVSHVLADVLRGEPEWSRLPANLHPRLPLLLERCLEKEPGNRLHDIADARVDIQKVLGDPGGVWARPADEAVRAVPSRKLPWVAAALLVGSLGAGLAVWYLKPAEPRPVVRFTHELAVNGFRISNRPVVALSPDGRRLVYNASGGLFLLSMDALEARVIPGTEQSVSTVMFSPDGEWVGYYSGSDRQFRKIAVTGGAPVVIASIEGVPFGASWTADNRILFALGQAIMSVSANGGAPDVLLTVEEGTPILPEMLPDGRAVIFTLGTGNEAQVVVQALDSGERKALVPGVRARYLPTGHLVYGVGGSLFAQRFDLAARAVAGGPVPVVEDVLTNVFPQYAVSDSGELAYIPGNAGAGASRTLAMVDPSGSITPLNIPPGVYSSPRVSPDGTRVVVQTTDASGIAPLTSPTGVIWVYDLSGETAIRRLTEGGNNKHPIWTPDGQRVTFASDRDGAMSIYWQPADGSGVAERLTTAKEGTQHWPDSWSPDGRTLSYQVISGVDYDLWTLSRHAPERSVVFVDGTQRQHGSVFSPDGRWLAYGSNEASPDDQIYVEPFPPTGVKYQVTQASGAFPVWSPDGKALVYRRGATATTGEMGAGLMQVEVVSESGFSWRNERRLPFERFLTFGGLRDYDMMPDGKRFVMVFRAGDSAPEERERPRVNVVLNWLEELKARVP
jgi:serine/threonine-protein kinase